MSEYNIQMNKYNALNAGYDQLYPATKIANVDGLGTALQNKAPSGFGYGDTQSIVFWNDEDGTKLEQALEARFAPDSLRNKVYRTKLVDYPICKVSGNGGFADILADNSNDSNGYPNSILIVFYAFNNNAVGPSIATKQKINGTWYPWEYVNPPMILGEECRTTERYLGKPVYVKAIEAGFNPAGMVKTTSDTNVSASGLVRFSAVRGAWQFPSLMYGGNYADDGNIQVSVQATSDGINVYTWSKTRDMTNATVNVQVYYTKD